MAPGGTGNVKAVEVFAISKLLDKQAATDKPWLPSLKAISYCGENGRHGIEEYLKLRVCFSPTKS